MLGVVSEHGLRYEVYRHISDSKRLKFKLSFYETQIIPHFLYLQLMNKVYFKDFWVYCPLDNPCTCWAFTDGLLYLTTTMTGALG